LFEDLFPFYPRQLIHPFSLIITIYLNSLKYDKSLTFSISFLLVVYRVYLALQQSVLSAFSISWASPSITQLHALRRLITSSDLNPASSSCLIILNSDRNRIISKEIRSEGQCIILYMYSFILAKIFVYNFYTNWNIFQKYLEIFGKFTSFLRIFHIDEFWNILKFFNL